MTERLILKLDSPVAELILNHPQRRNALNLEMWAAIPGLIEQAMSDRSVRVLLIHGGDGGHFAAGADISEFATHYATRGGAEAAAETLAQATAAIEACRAPVIAAIEGSCMGAGMSLATAADLRVVADGAKFCLPPARLGAAYPYGDLRRLSDIVGLAVTRDLLLTARVFDADEAAALGLASKRVEHGGALNAARETAAQMATLSPWALRAGKSMLNSLGQGQRTEPSAMRALQIEGFLGDDFLEGQRAFLDKRNPVFK